MSDTAFAPAKLPVFATLKKACRVSLKAVGPLLLLSLLFTPVFSFAILTVWLVSLLVGMSFSSSVITLGSTALVDFAMLAVAVPGFLAILWLTKRVLVGSFRLADAACDGRTLKFTDVLLNRRPNFLVFLALVLTVALMTLVGLIAFIVPGIMVVMAFGLAPIAMILEDKGLRDSLTRSRQLTAGNRWQCFGVYLVANLVYLPFYIASQSLMDVFNETENIPIIVAITGVSFVVSLLLSVFATVIPVVVFRELRALKDGSAEVVAPEPAPEPSPAP
ncbi:hypothetical protein [Phenylobacterium sp.]|uniref:hypothetical protein n=1 Tax=Phenylobacterium sp. TaxID=1871053 RepID=UPI0025D64322|nr:hypothetical protein [Phenylobacterium sp.]MCA6289874.1 hypothetical protein [Phenylobacterium sp.]MCA6311651.1 hypothetical protein [Phenylobacterium sp.]MCA6324837.1 hypothetical protein [Phenylobacterium sp.]MCA6338460.1 hypothetical protein [Phenylobacterium sp.]MCA6341019.1 hypothetical protein [Phenylobacterium sp.]